MPIDRSKLPYPGTDVTMSRRGGRHRQGGPQLHQLASGEAIAMGHAQWSKAYRESGGKLADAEGVFSFSESGVTFYGDSGPDDHWPYESIQSYSISGGLVSIVGRRTLRMDGGDGISLRIRLGKRLAANADYILAAKGIQRH